MIVSLYNEKNIHLHMPNSQSQKVDHAIVQVSDIDVVNGSFQF